jgi:predicted dienelactone hydrolase
MIIHVYDTATWLRAPHKKETCLGDRLFFKKENFKKIRIRELRAAVSKDAFHRSPSIFLVRIILKKIKGTSLNKENSF